MASPPYYCSGGNAGFALENCMKTGVIEDSILETAYAGFEATSMIDKLSNIANSKVYIYSGTEDSEVKPIVVNHQQSIYKHYGADVKTNYKIGSDHAIVTNKYGSKCDSFEAPYIVNCGFDLAYEALDHSIGLTSDSANDYKLSNLY